MKMLFANVLLAVLSIGFVNGLPQTNDVTISCGSTYEAVLGGNLTITYTFKTEETVKFTITYNQSKVLEVWPERRFRVEADTFNDERLQYSRTFYGTGRPKDAIKTFTIVLLGLTEDDDGAKFTYVYQLNLEDKGTGRWYVEEFTLPTTTVSVKDPEADAIPTDAIHDSPRK